MFRGRNILWLALLLVGGTRLLAASAAEKRDFNFAATLFSIGDWKNSETNFARFLETYPASELFAEAVLLEAQARFHFKQYDGAIQLLRSNQAKGGSWSDKFIYWIGEAQLAGGAIAEAADTFARVGKDFPASTNRFRACLREAEARSRLQQWPRVIELLHSPNSPFQQAIKAGPVGEPAVTGFLLLGEAQFQQKDFEGVAHTLDLMATKKMNAELAWRRSYLQCRMQLAQHRTQEALQTTTNLLEDAEGAASPVFVSESVALRAEVLERLGWLDEAVAAYKKYLTGGVPAERQRAAMLKVTELSLAQTNISEAVQTLEDFLNHYTNSAAADVALLTLGELRLKEFLGNRAATNLVGEATEKFDRLLATFPKGPLEGKAWLDKGWCLWLKGQLPDSLEAFQKAAVRLAGSADEAMARFKWADAQFKLGDFAGAITNYNYLVAANEALVKSGDPLMELALYQTVRAALESGNLAVATNALEKILTWYPEGFAGDSPLLLTEQGFRAAQGIPDRLGDRTLLLTGQGFVRANDPAKARDLFARFEKMYPTNALISEVRLATARTYERENKWGAAITNYDAWLESFTNRPGRTNAEFNLAWDNFKAGRETNAFVLFTNFVARYPADANALLAQWWIADYYFRQNDWISAESNYQLVYKSTNWPPSDLTYQAQMMAGRSAMARLRNGEAIGYFSNLPVDTNCPIELRLQASFAIGDAQMSRTDTTNHEADLQEAVRWFDSIYTKYPTNALAPLAWGEAGNCYLQMASATNHFFEMASNAYHQVLSLPQASVAARCQATVGLGLIAEKLAAQKPAGEQGPFFREALDRYEEVLFGSILRAGEKQDLSLVKEAGLNAVRVAMENLSDWKLALSLSTNIANSFPQLRPVFESKVIRAREYLNREKK